MKINKQKKSIVSLINFCSSLAVRYSAVGFLKTRHYLPAYSIIKRSPTKEKNNRHCFIERKTKEKMLVRCIDNICVLKLSKTFTLEKEALALYPAL